MKLSLKEFCDIVVDVNCSMVKKSKIKTTFTIMTYKNGEHKLHPFLYTTGSPLGYAQSVIDKESPEMYCIVSEAWMRVMTKEKGKEYEKNYKWGDMVNDPEKLECLIFLGRTTDLKESYSRTFYIHRKESGITLEELKDKKGNVPDMKSPKLK